MDATGATFAEGADLVDVNGGTHPFEVMLVLIRTLENDAERVQAADDSWEYNEYTWWLVECAIPYFPDLVAHLREAVQHMDVL